MSEAIPACIADFDGCITCGDHAVELSVIGVDEARGLAVCADESGASVEVDVLLVGAGGARRPAARPRRAPAIARAAA